MLKLFSFLFVFASVCFSQQPTWRDLRPDCTYSSFISTVPIAGKTCTCTDCGATETGSCVSGGNGALATFLDGSWKCTNLGSSEIMTDPIYLWAHFRDDDQTGIRFSYSRDAKNWSDMSKEVLYRPPGGLGVRDPSVTTKNNIFYLTHSPSTEAVIIPLIKTEDFITFTDYATINVPGLISGATAAWGPSFFHDVNSGKDFIIVAINFDNAWTATPFTPYLIELNLEAGTVVNATPLTVNGSAEGRVFDYDLYYHNGKYHLIYVDQPYIGDPATGVLHQPIAYATSTTLTGIYTQVNDPNTDYFGFTDQTEAPNFVPLENGCVRISVDLFGPLPAGPGSGGRIYKQVYKDSCGDMFLDTSLTPSKESEPLRMNVTNAENGHIIRLDPGSNYAQKVIRAANYYKTDLFVNGRFGINDNDPLYTLSVKGRAVDPGFIAYNEAVSLGLDSGKGDVAVLSACGKQTATCALSFPGTATFNVHHTGSGEMGMLQLSNSDAELGESSILFGGGIRTFGDRAQTNSRVGRKALWTIGTNKHVVTQPEQSDDWFFINNYGVGEIEAINKADVTLGAERNDVNGCVGMQIQIGAQDLYVNSLGRWIHPNNRGNHSMIILNSSGALVFQYSLNLSTAGALPKNRFTYLWVFPHYALLAGQTYFIMSTELSGSDQWYDISDVLPSSADFTITNAAWSANCGVDAVNVSGGANKAFGPVTFGYTKRGTSNIGSHLFAISPFTGEVRLNYGLTLGTGEPSAETKLTYGSIDTYGSFGSTKRINMGTGALGSNDAVVHMGQLVLSGGLSVTPGSDFTIGGDKVYFNLADSAFGAIQLNNPASSGESSMLFANNLTTFGAVPVSGDGNKALWSIGQNNPTWPSVGNNNFFFYNKAMNSNIGAFPFGIIQSTGAARANYGLVFGAGDGSALTTTNYGSIDAFGSFGSTPRINIGTGAVGSSDALVVTGGMALHGLFKRSGTNTDFTGTLQLSGGSTTGRIFDDPIRMNFASCVCTVRTIGSACFIETFNDLPSGPRFSAGANPPAPGAWIYYMCVGAMF